MQALAESERSRFVVVMLPLAVQLSDLGFAEFARSAPGSPGQPEIDRPQRLMWRGGDHLGLAVIAVLPGFRDWTMRGGRSLYLARAGHWSEPGNRLAADPARRALRP